jgi:transportin-3
VQALNHGAHPSARLAANQWLLGLQRSPQAWALAASLLASGDYPAPSADLLFFAAQMLRRKIQSPGAPLPDPAGQLLDALLVAARRFCLGPPRLLTQICLALAALALRAEGGVDGLFARMPHLPDPALLELLTVLPEEVAQDQSGDTGVDSASRCRYTRELLAHAPAVLDFLLAQSEKPDAAHEPSRRILRCLLSWVRTLRAQFNRVAFWLSLSLCCAKSNGDVVGPRGMLFRNACGRACRASTSHVRVQLPAGVIDLLNPLRGIGFVFTCSHVKYFVAVWS